MDPVEAKHQVLRKKCMQLIAEYTIALDEGFPPAVLNEFKYRLIKFTNKHPEFEGYLSRDVLWYRDSLKYKEKYI